MKILRWLYIMVILVGIAYYAHGQATITVSGTKVTDNNNNLLTGQLVFTVTDISGNPITYTPEGGSPTTATITIPVKKGVVQNVGGFPPQIPNPATMSPSNTRYQIQVQTTGGGTTYLDLVLTNITQSFFSYDAYQAPPNITINGIGLPRLPCVPTAMYHNNSASDTYPWVCSTLGGGGGIYWTQNPSENPACQGVAQAVVSPPVGSIFCTPSTNAFVTPGLIYGGPPSQTGAAPGPISVVPAPSGGGSPGGVDQDVQVKGGASSFSGANFSTDSATLTNLASPGWVNASHTAPAGELTYYITNGAYNALQAQTGSGNNGIAAAQAAAGANGTSFAPSSLSTVEAPGFAASDNTIYTDYRAGERVFQHNSITLDEDSDFQGKEESNCLVDGSLSTSNYICDGQNTFLFGPGVDIGNGVVTSHAGRYRNFVSYTPGIQSPDSGAYNFFATGDSNVYHYCNYVGGWLAGGDEGVNCFQRHTVEAANMFTGAVATGGAGATAVTVTATSAPSGFNAGGNGQYTNGMLLDLTQVSDSGKVVDITNGAPVVITTSTTHTASTVYGTTSTAIPNPGNWPTGASESFTLTTPSAGSFAVGDPFCFGGPGGWEESVVTAATGSAGTQTLTANLTLPNGAGAVVVKGGCQAITFSADTVVAPTVYGTTSTAIAAGSSATITLTTPSTGSFAVSDAICVGGPGGEDTTVTAVTGSGGSQTLTATLTQPYSARSLVFKGACHSTAFSSGTVVGVSDPPYLVIGAPSTTTYWVGYYAATGRDSGILAGANNAAFVPGAQAMTSIARTSNTVTALLSPSVQVAAMNDRVVAITGCADATYDGTVIATVVAQDPNNGNDAEITYASTGANGTTTGCSAAMTGTNGYYVYPMAKVLDVSDPSVVGMAAYLKHPTIAVDGYFHLGPNSVNWTASDDVEEPHPSSVLSGDDFSLSTQNAPTPPGDASYSISHIWTGRGQTGSYQPLVLRSAISPGEFRGLGGLLPPITAFATFSGVANTFFRLPFAPVGYGDLISVGCPPAPADDPFGSGSDCGSTTFYKVLNLGGGSIGGRLLFQPSSDTFQFDALNLNLNAPTHATQLDTQELTLKYGGSSLGVNFNNASGTLVNSVQECYPFDSVGEVDVALNCNNNGLTVPQPDGFLNVGVLQASYFAALNSTSVGLPLPSVRPSLVATGGGSTQWQYYFVATSPTGADGVSAIGVPTGTRFGNSSFVNAAATLDGTHFVTVTCPTAVQADYPSGTTYTTYVIGPGGTRRLGTCPINTSVVDNDSTTGFASSPNINWNADLGAGNLYVGYNGAVGFENTNDSTAVVDTFAVRGSAAGQVKLGTTRGAVDGDIEAATWNGKGVCASDGTNCTAAALPSGTINQMLYYAANGNVVAPLTLGTNLSITAGVLNASATAATNFSALVSGTNTTAAMTVGSGASIAPTGTGTIQATDIASTIAAGPNVTITGSGTVASPYSISATGGITGLVAGYVPIALSPTSIGDSLLDYGVTKASTFTFGAAVSIVDASGLGGGFDGTEGTAPTGATGVDNLWADSTSHRLLMNNNNGGAVTVASLSDFASSSLYGVAKCDGTTITCASGVFTAVSSGVADTTTTVGTTAVAANTCTSATTVTMTGVTTAFTFIFTPTTDVSGVTGWGSTGGLTIAAWPTANTLNYKVCNQTASSITPSASVTFNVGAR